jgi:hypothetical protein
MRARQVLIGPGPAVVEIEFELRRVVLTLGSHRDKFGLVGA